MQQKNEEIKNELVFVAFGFGGGGVKIQIVSEEEKKTCLDHETMELEDTYL